MKKILTALSLACAVSVASAKQTVLVSWGFSATATQAVLFRNLLDNANAQQSKYNFVFNHKPGAGGSIAANTVDSSTELAVLATSSSFYIRPLLYKESHNVDNFSMVGTICQGQPLAIFSKKLDSLSAAQQRSVTIGVLPGSITTLLTRTLTRENPALSLMEVPYKGTPEAMNDMMGGHTDGAVEFINKFYTDRFGTDVKVLGITGDRSINGLPTFRSLGFSGLGGVTVDFPLFVKASVPIEVQQELAGIFAAANGDSVKSVCIDDFGTPSSMPFGQLKSFNDASKTKWQKLTQGIPSN